MKFYYSQTNTCCFFERPHLISNYKRVIIIVINIIINIIIEYILPLSRGNKIHTTNIMLLLIINRKNGIDWGGGMGEGSRGSTKKKNYREKRRNVAGRNIPCFQN